MRFTILPIAFYAIAHAAPISSPDTTTEVISRRDDGSLRTFIPTARQVEEGGDTQTTEEPDYSGPSKFDVLNEDPTYSQIFQHVEDILDSAAPAKDQLESILDAIVHHKESLRKTHRDNLSPDELVLEIYRIVGGRQTSEEKIDSIYEEISRYSDNNEAADLPLDDTDAVVLQRIRLIMYGPESSQQRIHKMLDELANYFGLDESSYGIGLTGVQTTLAGVDVDRDYAVDVEEEVNTERGGSLEDVVEDAVGAVWR